MHISDEEFESAIEEALAGIPDRFRNALSNIGIAWAYEPDDRERGTMEHPDDDELLGLYEGVPLTERTSGYGGVMPDIITVFKGPHERLCDSREMMVAEIRTTVIHEIGHYFGLDDDYLHAYGY